MTQRYEYDIKKEIEDLLINYRNRVIRSTTDYQIVTIGRLQIENLNWKWKPSTDRLSMKTVLEYTPYDYRSPAPYDKFHGSFKVIKYGVSCRKNALTLGSYTPLWEPGTDKDEQAEIMAQEMYKMEIIGSRKCENGIEITPESPLWNTIDLLSTTARSTFRTLLGEKVKSLEAKHVQIDAEKLLNDGVPVTSEIVAILRILNTQIAM